MRTRRYRAGTLLDGVLSVFFFLVAAYVLSKVGITLWDLVEGARRFLGG